MSDIKNRFEEILSTKPIELDPDCKVCAFNRDSNNKGKPCYYKYCDKGGSRFPKEEKHDKI